MTRTVRMLMVVLVVVMVKSSDTNECKSSDPDKFSDLVERRPIAFSAVRLFDRDGDMGCRSKKRWNEWSNILRVLIGRCDET